MHRRLLLVLASACSAAAAAAGLPAAAAAQGRANELGGFYALSYTPAGALPIVVLVKNARDSMPRGSVAVRFGISKNRDDTLRINNYGASAKLRVWRGVSLGATYGYRTCESGCTGLSMASLDASGTLLHFDAQHPEEADTEIAYQLSIGYGKADKRDLSAKSFAASLPMTVSLSQMYDGLLTLSFIPSIARGSLADNDTTVLLPGTGTYTSTKFMIGAGIGYLFPVGLGVHATVHRIAIAESSAQSGLVATWRF